MAGRHDGHSLSPDRGAGWLPLLKPFQTGLGQFHLIADFELGARAAQLIVNRIGRFSEPARDFLVGQAARGQPNHRNLSGRELRQYRRLFQPDLRPDDRTKNSVMNWSK